MAVARVWRASDLAELYGVDESTVHRWERAGRLRAARRDPGGAKYRLRDEILADVEGASPRPPPPSSVAALVVATRRQRRRVG